ncbi:MAG: YbjN domain-containing protein [Myxococcales bacterium]|nr:YbjN domain-containing protein [Myxococcales bacterium]
MGRIFEGMKRFLIDHFDAEGLEPVDDETLAFRLEDEDGHEWGCMAVAVEAAEQVIFYSVALQPVAAERRDEVMRFVTMANYGMQVGNFELDLQDGEVRFKTAIDIEGVELSDGLIRNLVDLNLMMMGVYHDGLTAVMSGESTAAEAIAGIEDDDEDEDEDEDDD